MESVIVHPNESNNSASLNTNDLSWLKEPNQFNPQGNTMATDTIEVKLNGKLIGGTKSAKVKTDFEKKPKFLGVYYTAKGQLIEQLMGKSKDELQENLVLLQSKGAPNATVVVYKQDTAHKIKQQFDTV